MTIDYQYVITKDGEIVGREKCYADVERAWPQALTFKDGWLVDVVTIRERTD